MTREKRLKKEVQDLGILGIEVSGSLTPGLLQDAVNAVKGAKLDFAELSARAKSNLMRPSK